MKFGGSFDKNWSSADGSGNIDYKKDVLLDEIARMIELDKPTVVSLLKESGYSISPKASKKETINKVVDALYQSKQFRSDVSRSIEKATQKNSNVVGAIAGTVLVAVASIFGFAKSNKEAKTEKERTRQQLYDKLLTNNEQRNWIPVIVIGSVLLIGGIAAFFALRNKK
jgi:hypothetical protein